jgi:hypothetical protein
MSAMGEEWIDRNHGVRSSEVVILLILDRRLEMVFVSTSDRRSLKKSLELWEMCSERFYEVADRCPESCAITTRMPFH